MRYDRLYDCICILILSLLFKILLLLPSVCHTKITNGTFRIKPSSVSMRDTLIPNNRNNVNYTTEIRKILSLVSVSNDSVDITKDADVYRNSKKYKISKQSVKDNPQKAIVTDSIDYDDIPTCSDLQCLNEKTDYASKANESSVRLQKNRYEGTNDLVRTRRDVNADFDRYTEQDEESSLYDDYETKDIAKRGAIDDPEDYEEVEEEQEEEGSPSVLEDMLAVQEEGSMLDEMPKREMQDDVRVKRYQTATAERMGIAEITGKSSKRDIAPNKQEVNSMVDHSNVGHSKRNLEERKREDDVNRLMKQQSLKSVNGEEDTELSSSSNNDARFENDVKLGGYETPLNSYNNPQVSNYSTNLTEPSYSFDISKIVISKSIDNTKSNPNVLVKIDGTEIAASDPIELGRIEEKPKTAQEKSHYLCESPQIQLSKDINAISSDMSEIQGSDSEKRIAKLRDASNIVESTNAFSSKDDRSTNAAYENRVEEEIQRKIDSIKEEIKRDIEIQQRIKDIEDNNARFDELQDQERDNEEENYDNKLIGKSQNMAKRSIQAVTDNAAISSIHSDSKRILRKREDQKPQRRSNEIVKSNTPRERHSSRENVKRQSVVDYNHSPETALSPGSLKKKREHVRQTILVNNDRYHNKKKRQSRSYILPSETRDNDKLNEGGLSLNQDSSYLHADGKMVPLSSSNNENYSYDEDAENVAAAGEISHSLVPISESSLELSPRLAREYKEAFGGLQQNEPGNALARFKRIKRVLPLSSD